MIPRLQPGQEVSPALLNRIIDGVNSAEVTSSDFEVERTTAGTRLALPKSQPEFYAIITESPERYRVNGGEVVDGEYEWAEVVLGEDGFEEYADPNDGLASFYDIDSRQLYNPAYELNDNRKLEVGRIVRMKPYPPIEDETRGFLRRYIFSTEPTTRVPFWVKAQKNWTMAGLGGIVGARNYWVMVRRCDGLGNNETGDHLRMELPIAGGMTFTPPSTVQFGMMPNVVKGDVLAGAYMEDGLLVAVSDYLDEDVGTVVWFYGSEAEIRKGWKLCSAENAGYGVPDLSGRFILGLDPLNAAGDNSEDTVGDTGGFRWHGLTENNHDNHTSGVTHDGNLDDHVIDIDDGCFVYSIGGVGAAITACADPGGVFTELASGHVHEIDVGWFYKLGFEPSSYTTPTVTLPHTPNPWDHIVLMTHNGPYNAGQDTDNRPRFYVLAAKMRINNSQ